MKELFFDKVTQEYCYPKQFFIEQMKSEGLTEIDVYKAQTEKIEGMFWCKIDCECYEVSIEHWSCGKDCSSYTPRNGKKGCCKYYSNKFYSPGELTTLKNNQK